MSPELHWLEPSDPPDSFPDPSQALADPDGLLAVGGDLSNARLLAAYRNGIFPWYQDAQPVLWWSPDPRSVLFPLELRVSRSLRKTLRRNEFEVSVDQNFAGVIAGCAAARAEPGTWITTDMQAAYLALHRAGYAHSIETWRDNQLVGGLYGVNLGGVFFGESMFSRQTDASKVALVKLVSICKQSGIELIDCQLASAHLTSLGSRPVARTEFQQLLARLVHFPRHENWAEKTSLTRSILVESAE